MKNYPLIKYVLIFISGIILQKYTSIKIDYILLGITVTVIAFFSIYLALKNQNKYYSYFFSLLMLLLGTLIYSYQNINKVTYPFLEAKIKNVSVVGKICNIELKREKRITFYIKVDSTSIKILKNKHLFLCNYYGDERSIEKIYNKLHIGHKIVFKATLLRPRDQRNPYEFNYELYLNDRNISAIANIYKENEIKVIDSGNFSFNDLIFSIRKSIDVRLQSIHNKTTTAMLRGLLLADRSGIDSQINQDFINAGVIHVLSVSGLHVGFIIIIFLFLFNRLNIYLRTIFTLIGLFIYMIITGSEAPVFRSTIMGSIILITPLLGRESSGLNSLSLAAFILLILNPNDLFNPSFQLSFSAILSLILFLPNFKTYLESKKKLSTWKKNLLLFFCSTVSAQIGTLPFTLIYFGRISIASIIANYFVIPMSGFIVGLGITSLIFSYVSITIAKLYSYSNEFLNYILLNIVHYLGNTDYSIINIKQFSVYDGIIFYILIGLLFSFWKYVTNIYNKVLFVFMVCSLFMLYSQLDDYEILPKNKLSLIAIDVGQGDSFLIKFPNNKIALIDAGEANDKFDNGTRVILPLLEKLNIGKIDYGFISHVDSDHYMGFISLINANKISIIYKPVLDKNIKKDVELEKLIAKKGIKLQYYENKKIVIGNVNLYMLNDSVSIKKSKTINDKSGFIKLVYGKNSILFTGDIGLNMENYYIKRYQKFLRSDLLKAGHHGSKHSSSKKFLEFVKPNQVVISAGIGNKFNHPSKESIDRFKELGAIIFRTDLSGAQLFTSNGFEIKNYNWR